MPLSIDSTQASSPILSVRLRQETESPRVPPERSGGRNAAAGIGVRGKGRSLLPRSALSTAGRAFVGRFLALALLPHRVAAHLTPRRTNRRADASERTKGAGERCGIEGAAVWPGGHTKTGAQSGQRRNEQGV